MNSRIQVAGRPDQVLIRKQPLLRIPAWMVAIGLFMRGMWWLTVQAGKRPGTTAVLLSCAWIWSAHGGHALVVTLAVTALTLAGSSAVWRWRSPATFSRLVHLPLLGRWRRRWTYQRRWNDAMRMCGLGKMLDHRTDVPVLRKVVCTPATDRLVVRMLLGQNPESFRARSLDIAYSFGARTAQVFEQRPDSRPTRTGRLRWVLRLVDNWRWADRPADIHIVLIRKDSLAEIVAPLPFAAKDTAVDVTALPIAKSFTGDVFRFRLRANHLLISAASQRGKSGAIWALIASLAPAIHTGLVRVLAVDPKGGMELAMGRALFHRFAWRTYEDIANLLEEAVQVMRDRQDRFFDKARTHTVSYAEPLYVLVVDELATLTKYAPDLEFRRRIDGMLGLLLSQGAAVGVVVVGALQDPRKDNLDLRDLFLSRILLGVTSADQVDMVLGRGMRDRGAIADLLPENAKGVGFVVPDGSADPVKVRFPYLDDAAIRAMAKTYAAPAPEGPLTDVILAQSNGTKRGPLLPAALLAALNLGNAEGK